MSGRPDELAAWLKVGAAAVALLVALWKPLVGPLRSWRKRRQEERRTIRYLADAVHAMLRERVKNEMPDGDFWFPTEEDMAQQAIRVYEQRNTLFLADGHDIPKRVSLILSPSETAEVKDWIRRTQAIKLMTERKPENPQ